MAARASSSRRRSGGGSGSSGGSGRRRKAKGPTQLARHGVKGALILGMLLLIPGLWAILVLVGVPVPGAGGEGMGFSGKTMAYIMLLCLPISGCLIWGAVFFNKQHQKYDAMIAPPASPWAAISSRRDRTINHRDRPTSR